MLKGFTYFYPSNTNNSIYYRSFVCVWFNVFGYFYPSLTIQLNTSHLFTQIKWSNSSISNNSQVQFSFIWPIDRTLSGATSPGLSGHRSDGYEGVLYIPQSSTITEASPLLSVISRTLAGGVLPHCREAVHVFYRPSLLGNRWESLNPLQRCSRCIQQP